MSQTKAQLISDLVQALNFTGTSSAPTNGMYLSAANTISLGINTAELLTVNGTRILTKSPSGTNTTVRFQHTGNSGYGDIILDRSVNAFIIDNDPTNASNNQSYFAVKNKGATNFHIKFDGKVGIGTTSPGSKFTIANTSSTDANTTTDGAGFNSGTLYHRSRGDSAGIAGTTYSNQIISSNGTNVALEIYTIGATGTPVVFGTNSIERMRIEPGGNVGIGGTAANYQLHCTTGIGVGGHGLNNQQLSITNNSIQSLNLGVGYTALSLNALGGNVGIGTTSPSNLLHLKSGAPAIRLEDTDANGSAFSMIEDNNGLLKLRNDAGNAGTGSGITFEVDSSEKLRIYSDGDVKINDGDLVIGTAGHGIDFSATADGGTSIQEILDDYEEGSFSPTVSSTSRTGTINYSSQAGFYTKIGNRVFAQVYLQPGGGTNTSNHLFIDGLPFTCIGTASHEGGGYHTYQGAFFTSDANKQNLPWVSLNSTSVKFHKLDGNAVVGTDTSTATEYLIFHVQYIVA